MIYCDICGIELTQTDLENCLFMKETVPYCTECLEGLQ